MGHLLALAEALPRADYAFAYGSGVFQHFRSAAARGSAAVVDHIFAVRDPGEWHVENLRRNPGHYSSLCKALGASRSARLADSLGVGVLFNPYVRIGTGLYKYGIMSTSALLHDLESWDTLFVAGRLHKPVRCLVPHDIVDRARSRNFNAALCCALLLLPESFTKAELYRAVCGLSYHGDIRMWFAEDVSKLDNIVRGSEGELDRIYLDRLWGVCASKAGLMETRGMIRQDCHSHSSRAELLLALPSQLLASAAAKCGAVPSGSNAGAPLSRWDLSCAIASRSDYREALSRSLAGIVRRSSARQVALGMLTTDLKKSSLYLYEKVHKNWVTRRREARMR